MLGDDLVDAFFARQFAAVGQCLQILLAVEAALGFGTDEVFLAEVFHLDIAMLFIEGDQIGERANRRAWRTFGQVGIETSLQLIGQYFSLGSAVFAGIRQLDIDKNRALGG